MKNRFAISISPRYGDEVKWDMVDYILECNDEYASIMHLGKHNNHVHMHVYISTDLTEGELLSQFVKNCLTNENGLTSHMWKCKTLPTEKDVTRYLYYCLHETDIELLSFTDLSKEFSILKIGMEQKVKLWRYIRKASS